MEEKISPSERVALWISLIIPGIITALVDFDISIFVTYAVVASLIGEKAVWLLILVYAILHVLNSISGRVVIVADRGLIELIREHFGISVSSLVFITIGILDFLTVLQSILALHFISDLFRMNFAVFSIIFSAYLLFIFLFKIQKFANRVFVLIAVFYLSVVIHTAGLVPVLMTHLAASKLTIHDFFQQNIDLYFLAMLGATASAWNQFLITRYTYRTKLDLDKLDYHALDNRTATFSTFLFGGMFVGIMALLFPHGRLIANPSSLIDFIPISQPIIKLYFFAFGFLFIALTNIYAVSLSLSHTFTEFFGIERNNEEQGKFSTAQTVMYLCLVIPAIILVQITDIQLIQTAIILGFIQFLFIFILLYFLYRFANNRAIMGRYRNDWVHNAFLFLITIFLVFVFSEVFVRMLLKL